MLVKMISNVSYNGKDFVNDSVHDVDSKFIENCTGCFVLVKDLDGSEKIKDFKASDKMQRKVKTK